MQHTKNDGQRLLDISLGRITFLTFQEKIFLSKNLDSSYSLALLSIEDISQLLGRKLNKRVIWDGKENLRMAQAALAACQRLHIKILLHSDEQYPELLRQISDPPYILFCRGDEKILADKSVSVVGTRRFSQLGKTSTIDFSYQASVNGCNVVSGLANGIDGFAHQGAVNAWFDFLEKGEDISTLGKTIAVLPSAIDEIVPYGHRKLAENILKSGGCLISEYGPGVDMATWHFVARNRIIAGMSPATLVVEAPTGSGALITADFALENGRDVFFHQAAFGSVATQISSVVKSQLEIEHATGQVSRYKLENTPQKYLDAGAPVIKDYKDYCEALGEMPGKRSVSVQGELF